MILALAIVLLSAPLSGQDAGTNWMLENSAFSAQVAFHPSRGVALTSLISRSGVRYVEPKAPALLFLIKVRLERHAAPPNGRNPPLVNQVLEKKEYLLDGSGRWEMVSADFTEIEGAYLRLRLRRAEPGIEVVLQLRLRPGASPLEVSYAVKNLGRWTVFLDRFDSFNWVFATTPLENSTIYTVRKGTVRTNLLHLETKPFDGYSIKVGPVRDNDGEEFVPWFSIQRPGDAGGIYGGWAFSAFGEIMFRPGTDGFRISGGLDAAQLAIPVDPGQTRLAPMAFVSSYEGGLDDGANALHRYQERWLVPRPRVDLPLVNYNTWTAVGMNVTRQNMLEHIRMARDLGCELFHIDAGWHPQAGEWVPDPKRLPDGLLPIRNAAREAGLKFGLWVAFTQAGPALARRHPEWLTAPMPLNWDPPSYAGLTMCLAHPPARDHMAQVLEKSVSDFQLDYLEHDQSILQTCRRDFHGHSPQAGTYEQTLAYYQLHEDLLRRHPDLLLENCMGGGNILDFGVLQRFHLFSLTDLYDPLANRQAIYGATFPFPARYGEGYMKEVAGVSHHYQFRSYMMGYWALSVDTTKWPPEKVEACKRDIAAYKKIRSILRNGNVYHILPQPDGWHWDGMEYLDPASGRGVVFVFRPDSPDSSQVISLKGLDPKADYRVTFEDTSETFARSGQQLMESGLRISLAQRQSSALVYLNRESTR